MICAHVPFLMPDGKTINPVWFRLLADFYQTLGNVSSNGAGKPGATGAAAPLVYLPSEESDNEIMLIPGPVGLTGAVGPAGPAIGCLEAFDQDEPVLLPCRLSPGGWYDEKGSGGGYGFVAGVDFTAGVSTTLSLSRSYGSEANLIVSFGTGWQGADQFSLGGTTLTFLSAIPEGVEIVYVKGYINPF